MEPASQLTDSLVGIAYLATPCSNEANSKQPNDTAQSRDRIPNSRFRNQPSQ